jgi:hypothetical protein
MEREEEEKAGINEEKIKVASDISKGSVHLFKSIKCQKRHNLTSTAHARNHA